MDKKTNYCCEGSMRTLTAEIMANKEKRIKASPTR